MPAPALAALLAPRRDRLGLLVKKKGSPTLLGEAGVRLRALAEAKETPEARAEVEAALACPWWSLRELAIGVIGAWGGRRNKAWLMARAFRPVEPLDPVASGDRKARAWMRSETCAARRSVVPWLDERDAPALLRLWFVDQEPTDGWWSAAYERIPTDMLAAAASEQLRHGDSVRRRAAVRLLGSRLDDPGCFAAVSALAADRDTGVAGEVALRLRWHGWALERQALRRGK